MRWAPGIPMLFQGQEFLEGEWFRDTVPLDWDQRDKFHGIVRLYRALIWQGYSEDLEGHLNTNVVTEPGEYDGFPFHAALSIGPYSALIFSQ